MSKIGWTNKTWNPITGCTKVSAGCKNCYAEDIAKRFWGERKFTDIQCHPERLEYPMRWRKPRRIFVNSVSDIFHEEVPDDYVERIFDVMRECSQHQFQVLTKRAERVAEINQLVDWPKNVWMGVSVENADYIHRIDLLRETDARVKFLSLEPLLGPIRLDLEGIDWVIAGGESGPKWRNMEVDWVRSIRDQCVEQGVSLFVKQDSGRQSGLQGRIPDDLWIKEYPLVDVQAQNTLFGL